MKKVYVKHNGKKKGDTLKQTLCIIDKDSDIKKSFSIETHISKKDLAFEQLSNEVANYCCQNDLLITNMNLEFA